MLTNGQLAELLRLAADEEGGHRQRALLRASRAACFLWPVEAVTLVAERRSLTELPRVGPWIARRVLAWLEDPPPVPEPVELRRDFLTLGRAREIVAANPDWPRALRGDLQVHTTYSDGALPIAGMVEAARERDYAYIAITDHSKSLKIARGMDEAQLAAEGAEIVELNRQLDAAGVDFRVLRSIETDILADGSLDMERGALAELDLVLGAMHTRLRAPEDQTERYLTALHDPLLRILGHPRGRKYDRRVGIRADWDRVVAEATDRGVAIEIDASPDRQDLNLELLGLVRDAGAWVAIDTDAHAASELDFMVFGLAAAALARIPKDRVLNLMSADKLLAWSRR